MEFSERSTFFCGMSETVPCLFSRIFFKQNFDGNPRWDTSTFLLGMTVIQETLEVMQATLANKVTQLPAMRSEMICVMEAATRAELSRDLTARLGKTGKTATTPNPEDMNFVIQRLEDISNSQD
jgi:hypothetical protein